MAREEEPLSQSDQFYVQMMIVKTEVKFTNYVKVIDKELPKLAELEQGLEFT